MISPFGFSKLSRAMSFHIPLTSSHCTLIWGGHVVFFNMNINLSLYLEFPMVQGCVIYVLRVTQKWQHWNAVEFLHVLIFLLMKGISAIGHASSRYSLNLDEGIQDTFQCLFLLTFRYSRREQFDYSSWLISNFMLCSGDGTVIVSSFDLLWSETMIN